MTTIQSIKAREILDSRGNPTVEVELETLRGKGVASVPSGASVGTHEAHELRDNGGASRGVSEAIAHVNETIATAVEGKHFDQKSLDTFLCELDGTKNKSRLGANAILAVSVAFARAAAQEQDVELYEYLGSLDARKNFSLPVPLFNILNGGKHARDGIDIQECMLAPIGVSMRESVSAAEKGMAVLQSLLEQKGCSTGLGDEGGFAPALSSNDEALDLLVMSIKNAGYSTDQVKIALDVASSSFFEGGQYVLTSGGTRSLGSAQMVEWYAALAEKYPLISIEDGLAEDDWEGFTALEQKLGGALSVVGDDLTATNVERIHLAVQKKAANACIIKPNQIGTVIESIEAVRAARDAGWKLFASHRSGETMDTFIADFAVGLACDYIKAGAPTKKERMVKYARLIEIEERMSVV